MVMRRSFRLAAALALVGLAVPGYAAAAGRNSHPGASADLRFDFALIGDVPYNDEQTTKGFPNMIEELNQARLAFVVHDGDIKAGASPCTDDCFERIRAQFQTVRHPFVYLFGDNEWRDCGKVKTNAFDPLERLQKLRDLFTQGNQSLGQHTMTL